MSLDKPPYDPDGHVGNSDCAIYSAHKHIGIRQEKIRTEPFPVRADQPGKLPESLQN